mgnify:CR=1 FL=1
MTVPASGAAASRATLIGASAVVMWATLALLTTLSGKVPPFQLIALAFSCAFSIALAKWLWTGEAVLAKLKMPLRVWALGVCGLFGYHFFYFMALRNAPPIEAGLIAYLWPLLIVLTSALLPGERLRWWHVAGALMGLAGAATLVMGNSADGLAGFKSEYWLGYLMAILCALTWTAYSVLSRRFAHLPTDTVGVFCGATAILAMVAHLTFETTVWPSGGQWLAVLGLGLGPVGIAFFAWDYGVKHGNIQALGAISYGAPLLSTLLLIAAGKGEATINVALACVMIIGGAVLASKDMIARKK